MNFTAEQRKELRTVGATFFEAGHAEVVGKHEGNLNVKVVLTGNTDYRITLKPKFVLMNHNGTFLGAFDDSAELATEMLKYESQTGNPTRIRVEQEVPLCPICDTPTKPANGCAGYVLACDCDDE